MHSYRTIQDPSNSLPVVRFETYDTIDAGYFIRHKIDIFEGSLELKIGECDLIFGQEISHFDGIRLTKYWRGQGYGIASYLLAIETAAECEKPFGTQESTLSESAKNVWLQLARTGLAQEIRPFRSIFHTDDDQQLYTGKYIVPLLY